MPPVQSDARRRALVTDRDRLLLAFLAEHRVVTEGHVAALLDVGDPAAATRLRALRDAGLVRVERVFEGLPAATWITRRGLDAVGSRLPPPRLDLRGYRHDLGIGWLWLAARAGSFGALHSQVSERTMRSSDRRSDRTGPPYGVGIGAAGPRGGEQLHYPDLVLHLASGHRVAVELELSGKGRSRLDRIMLGYAGDDRFDAVLYLVPPGPIGRAVADAAQRTGIGRTVHVQRLAAGAPAGAPDPGWTHERAPALRAPVQREGR